MSEVGFEFYSDSLILSFGTPFAFILPILIFLLPFPSPVVSRHSLLFWHVLLYPSQMVPQYDASVVESGSNKSRQNMEINLFIKIEN